MLLLDEKGWITHMSVLVIGHAHCGKTQLIHTFLTRSSSHLTSRFSNLTTCHTSELSSPVTFTNTPALTSTQTPATATNPESDVYLSPYCPTIEDGHTFQFILPPNPAYAAHYVPPPPPPPSAHVPRDPILLINGEVPNEPAKSTIADSEERLRQNRQRVVLNIIDAGGDQAFSSLWPSMIEAADAYMLVYDVGDKASFEKVWGFFRLIVETKCQIPKEVPMLLVGSMVDTVGEKRHREVSLEMGNQLAGTLGIPFRETTAKALRSVEHCFRTVIEETQLRIHQLVSTAFESPQGRTGEDNGTGVGGMAGAAAIDTAPVVSNALGRGRWASANPLGGSFIKKWQNRRPSDSSLGSLASAISASSTSASSSTINANAHGAMSPNIGSASIVTSGSASPVASNAGFRFSAGSRRSLVSVERTESPDGAAGMKLRDSVQSGETHVDVNDIIHSLGGFGSGARTSRTSSGMSLGSAGSRTGSMQALPAVSEDVVKVTSIRPLSQLRPVRLDSTRYKRDVAFAAWKALQASRRNSIISISSVQSGRRGRSQGMGGHQHQRRISRGSLGATSDPPPVPPRRGRSENALSRTSMISGESLPEVAIAAEKLSESRRLSRDVGQNELAAVSSSSTPQELRSIHEMQTLYSSINNNIPSISSTPLSTKPLPPSPCKEMAEDHTATASPSTSSSATQRPTSSQPVDNGSTINTTTVSTRNSRVASFASATSSGIQRRNKPVRTDSLRWSTMGGVGLLGPHGSVRGSVSASSISTSISPPQSQLSSPSQSARPVPRSSSSHPTSAISSPHQSFTTAPITLSSSLSPPHRGVSGRGSRPSSPFSVGSFGVSPFRQEMSHPSSPVGPETSSGASSTDAIKITTIQQSATPLRPRAPSAPVAVGSDEKEDERQLRRNRTLRDNGSGSLEQTLVMLRSRRATSMGPAAPLAVAAIEMAARHRSVVEVAAVAVEAAMASNVGILDSGVNLRKTREGSAKPRPLSTASSVSVARDEDGWFGRPHGGMEDEIKSRPDGMVLEVDASPPRRGVDLGERWSGINSSMTKESQTILHRGRPSSTPFSSTKPRSRSTSDGDLSPRRNALTGGTTTAAVSPSLDHVCKNLQNMMEALEAYQVGEEGSLTPPDTPGARRGGSAASLLNLYVHDEDETEVSPPRPGSLRRSKSAGIIHGREESPVRDSSPSGAINRDASKSSPVASNLFRLSKGASSVGRVGMLGRIRSGSVSSANSQTRPSSISVISPMALDVLAKSEQGTASSNPLRPSLSAPMPLSSYLSDPDLVEQSATSVPPSPSNQYPNFHYGSWRPFEARRGRGGSDSSVELVSGHEPFLSHGTGAAHGAWGELRQPYDDDLELLQEMEGFMNDADVAALEIDVDGLNDAFCEALMSGVEEGEGESGAAGLGVIVVPAAAEAVNGVAAVTSHDEGSVSPTKRAAAQYIREELSDPLVSKRGSNYFPTPALWTPARKGSGTSSISAGPGSPRVTATPARNNEAVTSTCSRMTGTPRQSFAMATDEALPSSPSGTVKRSRLERLREVMEGLEERDVMEVVKEYIAKSAIAAATAASDNLAAP